MKPIKSSELKDGQVYEIKGLMFRINNELIGWDIIYDGYSNQVHLAKWLTDVGAKLIKEKK